MSGIQYVVNDKGERKAVILDLEEFGDLWEDICDYLVARSRNDEDEIPWEQLRSELGLGVAAGG